MKNKPVRSILGTLTITVFVLLFVSVAKPQSENVRPKTSTIKLRTMSLAESLFESSKETQYGDTQIGNAGSTISNNIQSWSNNLPGDTGFMWEQLKTANDNFSIEIPSNYETSLDSDALVVGDKSDVIITEWKTMRCYLDGAVLMVEMYKSNKLKAALSEIADWHFGDTQFPDGFKLTKRKIDKANGKEFELRGLNHYEKVQYFLGKEFVYVVLGISRNENNPLLQHFFSSLQVGEVRPNSSAANTNNSQNQKITTTEELDWSKFYKPSEATRKARIVWMVRPIYTEAARKSNNIGIVRISLVLSADGTVKDLKVVNGLPNGLTERAIQIAKRLLFFPAEKDGRLVSQYVTLEYNFRMY